MPPRACHIVYEWSGRKAGHYNHDIKCLAAEVNQCTLTKQSSFVLQLLVACWHQHTWALGWHPAGTEDLPAEREQDGPRPALRQRNMKETESGALMCPLTPVCSTTQLIYAAEMNFFTLGSHKYLKGFETVRFQGFERCCALLLWKIILGKSLFSFPFSSVFFLFCHHTFNLWVLTCHCIDALACGCCTDKCIHTCSPKITLNLHLVLIIAVEGTFRWRSGDLSSTGPLQSGWEWYLSVKYVWHQKALKVITN